MTDTPADRAAEFIADDQPTLAPLAFDTAFEDAADVGCLSHNAQRFVWDLVNAPELDGVDRDAAMTHVDMVLEQMRRHAVTLLEAIPA